jgi:alpha-tubulin suppressor-like RCC1 family protein
MAAAGRRVLATAGSLDCGRLGRGGAADALTVVRSLLDVDVAAVAAGGAHTAVLAADGALLTFGLNDAGQLGHSPGDGEAATAQEVPLPERAVAAAVGHRHTLVVTESGAVWAFGDDRHGQLGLGRGGGGNGDDGAAPRLLQALRGSPIVGVAAGAEHSLAVTASGEVLSWGAGARFQLGHGVAARALRFLAARDEPAPRLVRALETVRVSSVAAGHFHSLTVAADGALLSWGAGRFRQLGLPEDADAPAPRCVPGLPRAAAAAGGGAHSLAVESLGGAVLAFGTNQAGCLGLGEKAPPGVGVRAAARVPCVNAVSVAAGWKHSAAVTADGELLTWGWGGSEGGALTIQAGGSGGGQLALGDDFDRWAPTPVARLALGDGRVLARRGRDGRALWRAVQVAAGLNHTAVVVEIAPHVEL